MFPLGSSPFPGDSLLQTPQDPGTGFNNELCKNKKIYLMIFVEQEDNLSEVE